MDNMNEYDSLLLGNQLCFPLYASARRIIAAYHPFLTKIGLTYPQYITMMVLWEEKSITMHDLGQRLYLDSGTLTPVLKKLESLHYVKRSRLPGDERVVIVTITEEGMALREKAKAIPQALACRLMRKGDLFTPEEVDTLKKELYRIINALGKN